MIRLHRVALLSSLLTLILGTPLMRAQTTARLSGHVEDTSHATIPGASVTVTNTSTGLKRTATSDANGLYVVTELPVGSYSVSAEHEGFERKIAPSVVLSVSQAVTLNFDLPIGSLSQTVEISANAASVLESTTNTGTTLDTKAIEDLPINGRDYARFTLLAPGAVATTNIIANISFNGLQITANRFNIDGIDASRVDYPYISNGFERGARLLTGSLETIGEFRALTVGYQAEYGRASGGYVNIVTKSGANRLHGTVYDFIRNDLFDARNYFNPRTQRQAEFRYNDFGGSLGGAIRKDKDFFFLNYEGNRQRLGITGTSTTLSASARAQALATSPALALLVAQFPLGTGTTTNALVDSYATNGVGGVTEDTGSARIDHSFSANNHIFARVNINNSYIDGPVFGVFPASLGVNDYQNVPIRTSNVAINDQQIIGAHFVNEFLAGVQRFNSLILSEEPVPLLTITGIGITPGTRGRQQNVNTSWQMGDSMSYVLRAHTIKWGMSAYRLDINNRTAVTSTLLYSSIANFINNTAFSAAQTGANPGSTTRAYQAGAFVQDTWQARPGLTVDFGLRWDYQTTPFDPYNKQQTFLNTSNRLSAPGFAMYDDTKRDFGPRLGLAYKVNARMQLRTGFGVYYQQFPLYSTNQIATNNAAGTTSLLGTTTPGLKYPADSYLAAGAAATPSVVGFFPNKPDLYAEQWHLTTEYGLAHDTALSVAYVGNRSLHLRQNLNINYLNPTTRARPIAGFSNIIEEQAGGVGNYNALQIQLTQRQFHGMQATASYSYAHALDNVADFGVSSGYSLQPQDNSNILAEYGNSTSDIRHSFNFSVMYDLPFGHGKSFLADAHGFTDKLVSGWQISTLGFYRTGAPFNVSIATSQSGNGSTTNQRPNRLTGVSQYAANKTVTQWLNPAAFSVPATGTFGNLARNSVYGPGFQQLDLSFLKTTQLHEGVRLQLRAEIFNLPNTPNFALPSSTFGTSTFGQTLNTFGRTIGTGTARQMQMGGKFIF